MRLVTWNCKGAFARKHAAVASLRPDILVVPEAEKLTTVENVVGCKPVRSVEWVGENPRKGLAVLSYGDYSLSIHPAYDPRHRWIVLLTVDGPAAFTLFAVWAMPHVKSRWYIQSLIDALDTYRDLLESRPMVWAGDFNNNCSFDKGGATPTFANLYARMEQCGLRSVYHLQHGCTNGAERDMTFFLYHHPNKGHHIDYIFATPDLCDGGVEVVVGDHASWAAISDHMPVSCSFRLGGGKQKARSTRSRTSCLLRKPEGSLIAERGYSIWSWPKSFGTRSCGFTRRLRFRR